MLFTIPTNVVVIPPACEPIDVEDVKINAYVIDDDDEHKFIRTQIIPNARSVVEELAKRSLITQTRKQSYDYMPCSPVYLRYGPVQQIVSVTYTDANETVQTLASTFYTVDSSRIPARLTVAYNQTWPTAIHTTNSVNITYTAGYGSSANNVRPIYRSAVIALATHRYLNRDPLGCNDDEAVICRLENMLAIEGRTLEYA